MYLIHFLWPILIIVSSNADLLNDPVAAVLPDGTQLKALGLWYPVAVQGNDDINKQTKCFVGSIKLDNFGLFVELSYEYSEGIFQKNYSLGVSLKIPIVMSLYERNEDNSRGAMICQDTFKQFGRHLHVLKYDMVSSCKIGSGVDMTSVCAVRSLPMSDDDKEDLKQLCPPQKFVLIDQDNCKLSQGT